MRQNGRDNLQQHNNNSQFSASVNSFLSVLLGSLAVSRVLNSSISSMPIAAPGGSEIVFYKQRLESVRWTATMARGAITFIFLLGLALHTQDNTPCVRLPYVPPNRRRRRQESDDKSMNDLKKRRKNNEKFFSFDVSQTTYILKCCPLDNPSKHPPPIAQRLRAAGHGGPAADA